MSSLLLLLCCLIPLCLQGCISSEPPIHLMPDMDFQGRFGPQTYSAFYPDSAAMRTPPIGTVPRGALKEDDGFYRGVNADSRWLEKIPVMVDMDLMERGRNRYDIFCSPCHDQTGSGQGLVPKRGLVPPPTFHQPRIRALKDGEMFNIASNGVRSMPGYAKQIEEADRWAIVAYIRALQRIQMGEPLK